MHKMKINQFFNNLYSFQIKIENRVRFLIIGFIC